MFASNNAPSPPWRHEVILWGGQLSPDKPWRDHAVLRGRFLPEDPDDLMVEFGGPALGGIELMWVSVLDYHAPSGQYLGYLFNTPNFLRAVRVGDNIVFTATDAETMPRAVLEGARYCAAGLPPYAPATFFDAFAEGVHQYRQGAFGHNPPGIEAAIEAFRRAAAEVTDETSAGARYELAFFSGHCFAEKYETAHAIDAFSRAIALRPESSDAYMALLAEYAAWLRRPENACTDDDRVALARLFLELVDTIRARFPNDAECMQLLDGVLEIPHTEPRDDFYESLPAEFAGRLGSGVFRWKRK